MKVDRNALSILQSYAPKGANDPSGISRKGNADSSGSNGDQITISTEGQELQRAIRAAQQADEVRAERVAEIRTQLRSGQYLLNPQQIADRMLGIDGNSSSQ